MTNKTQLWVKPDPPGCGRGAREGLRGAAQGREFSVDLRGAEKRAGGGPWVVAGSGRLNREEAEFFKITVGDLEADDAWYRPPPEPRAVSGFALLAPGPFDLPDQGLLASKQPLPNAAIEA